MRLSKFNLWAEDYPKKGEHVLFNSRTQALIKINQEFREELERLSGPQIGDNLKGLKENGIIVEDLQEENAKLRDFFRQLKYESSRLPFEVTLLTTYKCNFKCVYCFEESVKESVFLDGDTCDAIATWLMNASEKNGYKRLFIVYYGGEPLLNAKPIHIISKQLSAWAGQKGIQFGFGIITNGSLVTPDLIDNLLSVGLQELRITLDGDRQAHDRMRPFADGKPTFDLIIENIRKVIDKVSVGLAGNFDRSNYDSIPGLLDHLEEEGLLRKFQKIDFAPIAPRLGPKSNPGAMELSECLMFVDKDGLFKEVLGLKRELMRRGLKVHTGLAINACSLIMQDGGVTIDPTGAIYKCNALLGYPEFSIGHVRDKEFNARYLEFLNSDAWNKCADDCPYVPMCQGGCRFFSYLENKNFSGLSCKREYLDRIVPELIKLEYDRMRQKQTD